MQNSIKAKLLGIVKILENLKLPLTLSTGILVNLIFASIAKFNRNIY